MYKIYNKTFQPIQILFEKETMILPKRERNAFVHVPYLNEQLKKLKREELIKVKEVN
jgi:hypothetical protein